MNIKIIKVGEVVVSVPFTLLNMGFDTMEIIYEDLLSLIPDNYIAIGVGEGGGHILMSISDDSNFGYTKLWFPDGNF